jgi:hypothetical protein
MPSLMTRRSAVLGTAALPLSTGLISLALPKSALACHLYVSPVDGRIGCGARDRDAKNTTSTSTSQSEPTTTTTTTTSQSEPSTTSPSTTTSPSPNTTTSTSGLVYRDELCGFNQSLKSGHRSRLSVSRAPDGQSAIEAVYLQGRSACGATTFLDLFSGNGVGRAVFEVDLWISRPFEDIPGKLCGAYGGGDAWGGQVAGNLGCRVAGGWSSRLTHGRLDRVDLYSYHQNRDTTCHSNGKQFGKTFISRQKLIYGRWATFRHEIVMNTPGNSNGVVRLWLDGSKLIEIGGLMYQQDSARYGIKGWSIWSALGGSCNSSSFFPKNDIRVWYRDLRVYT